MKKIILLSLIIILSGCSIQQKSSLSLKEKCGSYYFNGQKQMEQLKEKLANAKNSNVQLRGVFYSKTKNTCVTVIQEMTTNIFFFYDTLTGNNIGGATVEDEKKLELVY